MTSIFPQMKNDPDFDFKSIQLLKLDSSPKTGEDKSGGDREQTSTIRDVLSLGSITFLMTQVGGPLLGVFALLHHDTLRAGAHVVMGIAKPKRDHKTPGAAAEIGNMCVGAINQLSPVTPAVNRPGSSGDSLL